MVLHTRKLPHLYAIEQPIFVTFRLYGSLPRGRAFPPANVTSGEAFVAMDRLLDECRSGPTFLRQHRVAEEVRQSIVYGEEIGHYHLHEWVIMPNHVHMLFTPYVNVSRILRSLKSSSSRRANAFLMRTDQPFWQAESYDHLVRNAEEFRKIQRY